MAAVTAIVASHPPIARLLAAVNSSPRDSSASGQPLAFVWHRRVVFLALRLSRAPQDKGQPRSLDVYE